LEEDVPERLHDGKSYPNWWVTLRKHHFSRIWQSQDTFGETWGQNVVHSAWAKPGLLGTRTSCEQHRERNIYAVRQLRCLPLADPPMYDMIDKGRHRLNRTRSLG
jgi:hypothetical protein